MLHRFVYGFTRQRSLPLLCAALVSGCAGGAQTSDQSGVRIVMRTPEEFCRGTGRSIAIDRHEMKRKGAPLKEALELNNGVPVIDAITRAVYASSASSETEAAAAGSKACLAYFRNR